MKTTTSIDFKIQGLNESHTGSAAIIDLNSTYPLGDLKQQAIDAHESENVTIRKIGSIWNAELAQPGYEDNYDVYETYVDSGSDDYWYFAINVGSREL